MPRPDFIKRAIGNVRINLKETVVFGNRFRRRLTKKMQKGRNEMKHTVRILALALAALTLVACANTPAPVVTDENTTAATTIDVPSTTEVPATTDTPETTAAPATTEAPVTTAALATTEAPATTVVPVTTAAPSTTAAPVTMRPPQRRLRQRRQKPRGSPMRSTPTVKATR